MKPKKDERELKLIIPDSLYVMLREHAENDIRSMSNQARYFIEIGMEYCQHLQAQSEQAQERESAIGFQVNSDQEYEEEELKKRR